MDNISDRNRNFRTIFEALLSKYNVKIIVVDRPGLKLPPSVWPVREDASKAHVLTSTGMSRSVTLEYGLNMPVPIDDLKITDIGIEATLSFSREPHHTFVPWEAVVDMAPVLGVGLSSSAPIRKKPKLKLVP
jgi:hypothetical protein